MLRPASDYHHELFIIFKILGCHQYSLSGVVLGKVCKCLMCCFVCCECQTWQSLRNISMTIYTREAVDTGSRPRQAQSPVIVHYCSGRRRSCDVSLVAASNSGIIIVNRAFDFTSLSRGNGRHASSYFNLPNSTLILISIHIFDLGTYVYNLHVPTLQSR